MNIFMHHNDLVLGDLGLARGYEKEDELKTELY